MNAYLDANIIVPLFWSEPTTDAVIAFIARHDNDLHVSTLAAGEFAATISRLTRTRYLAEATARASFTFFDQWFGNDVVQIETDGALVAEAITLVRRFDLGLRMPDAIHAATCLHLDLTLATFDTKLARAATALGIDVIVPA